MENNYIGPVVSSEDEDIILQELQARIKVHETRKNELADMKGELHRSKCEVEGLRRELSLTVEERDKLTTKLGLAEATNLELQRELENMATKFGLQEGAIPSTSSITADKTDGADTGTRKGKMNGESLSLGVFRSNQWNLDKASPSEQPTHMTSPPSDTDVIVESSPLVVPEASSSTLKPRTLAKTKSIPRRGQRMAKGIVIVEVDMDESENRAESTARSEQDEPDKVVPTETGVDNSREPKAGPSSAAVSMPVSIPENSQAPDHPQHGVDPSDPRRCVCGGRFGTESLQWHINYYAGKSTRTCRVCGKKLPNLKSWKCHMKRHTRKSLACSSNVNLPGGRNRNSLLKKTSRAVVDREDTVSRVDRFQCSMCPTIFTDLRGLKVHFRKSHLQFEK